MLHALRKIFSATVDGGNLHIIDAYGVRHAFGDGRGAPTVVRISDRATERRIAINPELCLGEAFMDGRFVPVEGRIYDVLEILLSGMRVKPTPAWMQTIRGYRYLTRRLRQYNPITRAKSNVAHHYNLSSEFYALFLDADKQYSCAYMEGQDPSLEEAQLAKKRHITAKLKIEPGMHVLDIGSGWGGLALYLARQAGAEVTGITLSEEQLVAARERARNDGLHNQVRFELSDYRELSASFDRIVSVGMFEHVGVGHYATFFSKLHDCLKPDGVALLHSIGRSTPPSSTNSWIAKYIFPGGYLPSLSEVIPVIERCGLIVSDVEVLRLHYAETLRMWRERFLSNWDRVARLYDERFCRMWEFYLAASEAAFRHQDLVVFQIQMIKNPEALPITRDYMVTDEARLARNEQAAC